MEKKSKKKYKIEGHTIVIPERTFATLDAETMALIKKYESVGYTVEIRQPKKAKGQRTTKALIEKTWANEPEKLERFHKLLEAEGFFVAKKEFDAEMKALKKEADK